MSEITAPAPTAPATEGNATSGDMGETSVDTQTETETPKPKKPNFRKYKIGNEEISLSDDDIARDYSKWKGSDKAFREASEAKKATEAFMKALKEDPEKILNDGRIPIDKRKLAEKWLLEEIEKEMNPADPRDAKLSDAEKRLKEYQDREEAELKAKEEQEYESVKEQRKSEILKVLSQAMQATHLSKDPESAASVLREMAIYMRAAKERGEDVTPDELVEHIHNQRFGQFYNLAHKFDGDELIEFLGEEIVNRIRKSDLARLRAGRGEGNPQSHKNDSWTPPKPASTPKRMSGLDAREHANKILFGK
jgi:uncharacterized protein YeaO (DUF488 family)